MLQALGEVSIKSSTDGGGLGRKIVGRFALKVLKDTLGEKCPPPLPEIPSYEEWCAGDAKARKG